MTENQLLDETLNIFNEKGTEEAYMFLLSNLDEIKEISSQVYNFLYCLAATSGKLNDAFGWMEEAIVVKRLWYRPEVFEDEDLDSIRSDERFIEYNKLSNKRYHEALEKVNTESTWKEIQADNLMIVLHGNQQNNEISKEYWSVFADSNYQIEYLQSKEIDSYQLFRWNDEGDGPIQVEKVITSIEWDKYNCTVLAGFSAGCNTILRALNETDVYCNKIIMQSPWIPSIENDIDEIIRTLIDKEVEVLIICGQKDEDCLPQSKEFESKAKELGLKCKAVYIDDLSHGYPNNFKEIVEEFL